MVGAMNVVIQENQSVVCGALSVEIRLVGQRETACGGRRGS